MSDSYLLAVDEQLGEHDARQTLSLLFVEAAEGVDTIETAKGHTS